jgi:hypothetical protein
VWRGRDDPRVVALGRGSVETPGDDVQREGAAASPHSEVMAVSILAD